MSPRTRTAPPAAPVPPGPPTSARPPRTFRLGPGRAALLPLACAGALGAMALATARSDRGLTLSLAAAGTVLALWAGGLWISGRRSGRTLTLTWLPRPQHWVQMLAQVTIYVWWARYVPTIEAFVPFLVPQIVFAYGVDALLQWSRREGWALGFGPIPVILSINLFLLFRPEWFFWQFVMILVGFLAKDMIRWTKDGRSAHIFNPSSFPLAITSVVLIATGTGSATFGDFIANTIHDPAHIYLVIVLAALPGQVLFGVARMTLASVATMMAISYAWFGVTGTYLFLDSHIPVPVFLGMHLLFTDPSTSPRSAGGRLLFGATYSILTAAFYLLLPLVGAPTFYDKLLPVPLMNLMVRRFDRIAARWGELVGRPGAAAGRPAPAPARAPVRGNLAWATSWCALFAVFHAGDALGDRHPGQYLPFWREACAAGSERACRYEASLTLTYCNNGSGWACNEIGVLEARAGRPADAAFQRACVLGFAPGCRNAAGEGPGAPAPVRAEPALADLPIVLRGTKPALTTRDPEVLRAEACRQGWPGACGGAVGAPAG